MEKLNREILAMNDELLQTQISIPKPFNFSTIRDNFRLHIHNRRNLNSADNVLLDEKLIESLLALKQKSFEILQQFRDLNQRTKKDVKTFESLEDFLGFVVTQEEILNAELWKLQGISSYLEQLKLLDLASDPHNESQCA